jgi:predicted enzyme related to lactoylglutathione lyase
MPEGIPGHLTFYVEVPDVEAALAQAENLGGTRVMSPTEVQPGVELGQFSDPEGHMVGLLKGPA